MGLQKRRVEQLRLIARAAVAAKDACAAAAAGAVPDAEEAAVSVRFEFAAPADAAGAAAPKVNTAISTAMMILTIVML